MIQYIRVSNFFHLSLSLSLSCRPYCGLHYRNTTESEYSSLRNGSHRGTHKAKRMAPFWHVTEQ